MNYRENNKFDPKHLTKSIGNKNANSLSKKSFFEITEVQDSIIKGSLLGDGHLQKRGNSYRLKFGHCEKQKEFLEWKFNQLKVLCENNRGISSYQKNGKNYFEFYTNSKIELKKYHDLFYKEIVRSDGTKFYKKTITSELIENLPKNNFVLATLYLDDGNARSDCYSGKIATQGFSKQESNLLVDYFNKWDIETKIVLHDRKKESYYLSIPAKSFSKFVNVIEPVINEIPSMKYKLNEINKNKSKFKE